MCFSKVARLVIDPAVSFLKAWELPFGAYLVAPKTVCDSKRSYKVNIESEVLLHLPD